MSILWLKDHQLYTDQLVKSGHEFYRCISKCRGRWENYQDNWILIPLYSKKGHKEVRFPIWTYHQSPDFRNTIIIKNYDIYCQLESMFWTYPYKGLINKLRVVMDGKMKWMIQFPDAPAMFL